MPCYEYHCKACKTVFDFEHSIHDEALTQCPLCGKKKKIERCITTPMFMWVKNICLGIHAENNTKALGGMDYLEWQKDEKYKKAKKNLERQAEEKGVEIIVDKPKTPWWRDGSVPGLPKSDKPVDTSKITNIRKYIETGSKI
jgi:putative FmdB family regulatory protein